MCELRKKHEFQFQDFCFEYKIVWNANSGTIDLASSGRHCAFQNGRIRVAPMRMFNVCAEEYLLSGSIIYRGTGALFTHAFSDSM